jgi:hypothetical protein
MGLTITLAPFQSADNVAYGAFGIQSRTAAVTPGSGFTEIAEVPSNESPSSDLQAQWMLNSNTVHASWANLPGGALAVEIRARTGAP